jgi:hypothetical protein
MTNLSKSTNSEYWFARAARSRAIAETLLDDAMRELLLHVAADYMRIAERAAKREAAVKAAQSANEKTGAVTSSDEPVPTT